MNSSLLLVCWIILGLATAHLANKRSKNPYLWFFMGFFLGILAIGLLLFLLYKDKKKLKKSPKKTHPLDSIQNNKLWYYLEGKNLLGPMSFAALKQKLQEEKINLSTYVWQEDMENWEKIESLLKHNFFSKKSSTS